jgi:hypothetical protein
MSRYNFETFKGRAKERPRVFPDRGEGRVGGLAKALTREEEVERILSESTKPRGLNSAPFPRPPFKERL